MSQKAADADDRARLEHLLEQVSSSGGRIIIPTPAFAEFLVGVDESAADWINDLDRKQAIYVAPFDRRSAFECSLLDKAAINRGDKRGGSDKTWQAVKFDRQIVAIARVNQAPVIVTNDRGVRMTATSAGMKALRIAELDLPDSAKQMPLLEPEPPKRRSNLRS